MQGLGKAIYLIYPLFPIHWKTNNGQSLGITRHPVNDIVDT
ncbi:hypothetical protein RLIN73S_01808 [Rhodanobacter lindaniclasticus]